MIELVYVSRAQEHFTESQLVSLLAQARTNNISLGITGLLLYDNKGTFIQALEGDAEQVVMLFKKIHNDERHSKINIVSRRNISARAFPDWSMGFKIIDDNSIQELAGYSGCMQQKTPLGSMQQSTSIAIDLLNYFRKT